MRAQEFLSEANKMTLRDFVVTISPHALERCYDRKINSRFVDDILRNISRVKDNIMGMEPGAAFILHNGLNTGLGVRRGQGNKLTLATVFRTDPDFVRGKHPTFRVETYPNVKEPK
jgi:hypothetical protein